jgi:hypothetical protein
MHVKRKTDHPESKKKSELKILQKNVAQYGEKVISEISRHT